MEEEETRLNYEHLLPSISSVAHPHLQLLSSLLPVEPQTTSECLDASADKSPVHCCNCNASMDGESSKILQDVITCQLPHATLDTLAIGSVKICDVLKILYRVENVNDEALLTGLVMCVKCTNFLTKLYGLYCEFLSISVRSSSLLAKCADKAIKLLQVKQVDTASSTEANNCNKSGNSNNSCSTRKLTNILHNERGQTVLKSAEGDHGNKKTSTRRTSPRKKVKTTPKCHAKEDKTIELDVAVASVASSPLLDNSDEQVSAESPSTDTCDRCGKRFKSFGGLKIHYASHLRDDNKIACKECGKRFKKAEALEMHQRIDHKGFKPHKCPHEGCDRSFRLKDKLRLHIKVMHEKKKPFPCSKCEKAFRTRYHLKAHDVAQHVQGDTSIGCSQCRRKFPSKEALEIHVKTHDEEKLFVCSECKKGFKTASRLRLHAKSHDALPSTVCATCGKAYKHIRDLKLHEVIHEGESSFRFACGDCPRKFYRIDLLRVHQSNEKHFSPEVVGPCVSKMSDVSGNSSSKEKRCKQQSREASTDPSNASTTTTAPKRRRKQVVQKTVKIDLSSKLKASEPLFDCLGSPTLFPIPTMATAVSAVAVDDHVSNLEIVELTPTLTNTAILTNNSLYRKSITQQDTSGMPESSSSFILNSKDPLITNLVNATATTNIGQSSPMIPQASPFSLGSAGSAIYTLKDSSDRTGTAISAFSISAGAEQIGYDVINAFINNLN